jgi:hypothetical protein
MGLIAPLLLSAALAATPVDPAPPAPVCSTPAKTAAAASVTETPVSATSDWGIEELTEGLFQPNASDIRWPTACHVNVERLVGWSLATSTGDLFWIDDKPGLSVRAFPLSPREVEPAHPAVPGASFVLSAPLSAGFWRAGLWRQRDGHWLIAAYRPASADAPLPILRSRTPIIDLSYLGSPDTFGGGMTILQRTGRGAYRLIRLGWSEKVLIGPDRRYRS